MHEVHSLFRSKKWRFKLTEFSVSPPGMVMYDFFSMISFRLLILKSGVIFDLEATEIISKWFIAFQVII